MADDPANAQSSNQGGNDAADERQNEPRTGIPGKGFDAGTGYGGGGNDSLYSAESSYGGQSGIGGSRMRGAYAGEDYGRSGPGEEQPGGDGDAAQGDAPNPALDTDGRGSANDTADVDPNVEAVTGAFEGRGVDGGDASGDASNDDMPASGLSVDGPDTIDLEDFSGGSRREPGR